ncbi:MAG: hypothetical protein JO353_13695 [Phycisphaerae bacterium]|nr:hypothetical protein [Phycisphaerae bacterium]
MSLLHQNLTAPPAHAIAVPPWVFQCVAWESASLLERDALSLKRHAGDEYHLISATIENADSLDDRSFQARTIDAYREIFSQIVLSDALYPVRFWNFLPDVHHPCDDGRDRYQVFNAGRFSAFEKHYGGRARFANAVATASAVGHQDDDLVIHCLARHKPAQPIDNPAQTRPYHYSQRYGPLPPCFARGMRIGPSTLLVGGTASIVGEDSMHPGDLEAQTRQTLENLSILVQSSGIAPGIHSPLQLFTSLRVYHPNRADAEHLLDLLGDSFPRVGSIEFVRADLCRRELLVEIEGVCGHLHE